MRRELNLVFEEPKNIGIVVRFWETAHQALPYANILPQVRSNVLMLAKGRGRWAVSQKRITIEYCYSPLPHQIHHCRATPTNRKVSC